jgi:hypothetical protein
MVSQRMSIIAMITVVLTIVYQCVLLATASTPKVSNKPVSVVAMTMTSMQLKQNYYKLLTFIEL